MAKDTTTVSQHKIWDKFVLNIALDENTIQILLNTP
jgi:hypothetical protein